MATLFLELGAVMLNYVLDHRGNLISTSHLFLAPGNICNKVTYALSDL